MVHTACRRSAALFAVLIAAVVGLAWGFAPAPAYAQEAPAHSKTLTLNDDGTGTLSLSVTGHAESTSESDKGGRHRGPGHVFVHGL